MVVHDLGRLRPFGMPALGIDVEGLDLGRCSFEESRGLAIRAAS